MDLGSWPLVLGAWWGEPRCWMVISVWSVLAMEDGGWNLVANAARPEYSVQNLKSQQFGGEECSEAGRNGPSRDPTSL